MKLNTLTTRASRPLGARTRLCALLCILCFLPFEPALGLTKLFPPRHSAIGQMAQQPTPLRLVANRQTPAPPAATTAGPSVDTSSAPSAPANPNAPGQPNPATSTRPAERILSATWNTQGLPKASVRTYMTKQKANRWQATFDQDGPWGQVVNQPRLYSLAFAKPDGWRYEPTTKLWTGKVPAKISVTTGGGTGEPESRTGGIAVEAQIVGFKLKQVTNSPRPSLADWQRVEKSFPLTRFLQGTDEYLLGEMRLIALGCYEFHAELDWQIKSTVTSTGAPLAPPPTTSSSELTPSGTPEPSPPGWSSRTQITTSTPLSLSAVAVKSAIAGKDGLDTNRDITKHCHGPIPSGEVQVRREAIPPIAVIKATPDSGPAPLATQLDGSGSYTQDGSRIVEYRWDTNGDNRVDRSTTGPVTRETYQAGTPVAKLKVVNEDGLESTEWSSVVLCSAGPPVAEITQAHQAGKVPDINAQASLAGRITAACPNHPHAPKVSRVRWEWDDYWHQNRDTSSRAWQGSVNDTASLLYHATTPPAGDGQPNWYSHGRGWRQPTLRGWDSFGTQSNTATTGIYINTPPQTWVAEHFCEPQPCKQVRLRADLVHSARDNESATVQRLHSWWQVTNNRGFNSSSETDTANTSEFRKQLFYKIALPFDLREGSSAIDIDGEHSYRNLCNHYVHPRNHRTQNYPFFC